MSAQGRIAALFAALVALPATASANPIEGVVFEDRDESGTFTAGDVPVANAVVAWEGSAFTTTSADGLFQLDAPYVGGIVWVRTPEGFVPGPVWKKVDGTRVELPLRRSATPGPARFVVTSDTHTSVRRLPGPQLERALDQATSLYPPPQFFVITGDMSQANEPEQFEIVAKAARATGVPFVPVAGNHDWTDGGETYRSTFGPPSYSFDTGGAHFIVLNDSDPENTRELFLRNDLARVAPDVKVIAFMHAPPPAAFSAVLESIGVDYLFTGHLHSNRIHRHQTLIDYNTEPLVMGGIDQTPAGYRIVWLDGDELRLDHRAVVETRIAHLAFPRPEECATGPQVRIAAAVNVGAVKPRVTVRVDGRAEWTELEHRGGWLYSADVDGLSPGEHRVTLTVNRGNGDAESSQYSIQVIGSTPNSVHIADWPQHGGTAARRGATPRDITAPLSTRWATDVGGALHGGSPVVAAGRVFVSIADFNDGHAGGVVALDAQTGRELWRFRAGNGVRNAPAATAETVVFGDTGGTVYGLDAASGAERWRYQLGDGVPPHERSLHGSPAIVGNTVYAGIQRELVSLALATGRVKWSRVPAEVGGWFASRASPAIAGERMVTTFSRGTFGLFAWNRSSSDLLWRAERDAVTQGMQASPVIAGRHVYTADETTRISSLDLETGELEWAVRLDDAGFPWGYGVVATPATAHGLLFVPTLHDFLYAIDADTGALVWKLRANPALIRPAHYRYAVSGFTSSPVVTGSTLWIGGADGVLRAVNSLSGEELWSFDVGAPIASAPAPAGSMLIVASYDGMVRGLVPTSDSACPVIRSAVQIPASKDPRLGVLVLIAAGFASLRLRKR